MALHVNAYHFIACHVLRAIGRTLLFSVGSRCCVLAAHAYLSFSGCLGVRSYGVCGFWLIVVLFQSPVFLSAPSLKDELFKMAILDKV